MARNTRELIKESFRHLLTQRKLSEITVKDIVADCNVNRGSFYYHYKDIPMIIQEIIKDKTDEIVLKYSDDVSPLGCLEEMMKIIIDNKTETLNIYRSVSRDTLESSLNHLCTYIIKKYSDLMRGKSNLPPEVEKSNYEFYRYALFGFCLDWLEHGLNDEQALQLRDCIMAWIRQMDKLKEND